MLEPVSPRTLRSALLSAPGPEELSRLCISERERLRSQMLSAPVGSRHCAALTELCDLAIQRLFSLALPEGAGAREATRPKISIAATGGYGRRELCPYSDIDVTFVVAEEEDPLLDATVRQMFHTIMEVFHQRCGLKVGYGYRTLADAVRLETETQTALVDLRVVAGSHRLAEEFRREVFQHVWPAAFVRTKLAERREQWERHGGAIHQIEPEVREGPGGLRDLHLAEWLATVSFPSTRGDVWRQLQRLGAVSPADVQGVTEAREFLLTARNWNHWKAQRHADRLVRERQEGLAEALRLPDDRDLSRVERLMERYYRAAETVARISSFVADRCLAERLSLSEALGCSGSELHVAYPWVRVTEPDFLMEVAQNFQSHGLQPGHELRRMISQHLESCSPLAEDPEAAQDFVGLLRALPPPGRHYASQTAGTPPGVYATLRLFADLGLLQRLIPELGAAYRRVPFDVAHRHSIGFHMLETVRHLERLRFTDESNLEDFRRAWGVVEAPEVLYLGALLHDIGKLAGTGPHAETGAHATRDIAERLGLEPDLAQRAERLVRLHMVMSETAQLRDVTLEKTIHDFTDAVGSLDMLHMLLVLTYADMAATGVLNPAKVRFLLDLYVRAEARFTGATEPPGRQEWERRLRSRLSRRLSATSLRPEQIQSHTEGMPVSYLLNTPADEIALHIRMLEALRHDGPVVEFARSATSPITTIHLCTEERPEPGLLSEIAGVFYAHDLAVYGAQVFTRPGEPPVALDTLWADYHGRPIPPFKCLELEQDLLYVLRGSPVEDVIVRRRRRLPPAVPPHAVRFDNDLAEGQTVVEMRAEDQPGLLYRVTRAFADLGWDIRSARISTRADEARDSFYVTGPTGGQLEEHPTRLKDAFLAQFGTDSFREEVKQCP